MANDELAEWGDIAGPPMSRPGWYKRYDKPRFLDGKLVRLCHLDIRASPLSDDERMVACDALEVGWQRALMTPRPVRSRTRQDRRPHGIDWSYGTWRRVYPKRRKRKRR